MITSASSAAAAEMTKAWRGALGAAAASRGLALQPAQSFRFDPEGQLEPADAEASLLWRDGRWELIEAPTAAAGALLDLYLPFCTGPLVIGHLGQSLDGFIATESGDSNFVTGRENIVHLHRMRALCDAVVVGAATVESDNPRLTTRLVEGPNPVRVVIDPTLRLRPDRHVFADGEAETLVICAEGSRRCGYADSAEILTLPRVGKRLDLGSLPGSLERRGLKTLFVEGGGITVSAFLEAGLLDRLQVAVAPLVIGRGRPGLRLPGRAALDECVRPAHRIFMMGPDVLFDCDLRGSADRPTVNGGISPDER